MRLIDADALQEALREFEKQEPTLDYICGTMRAGVIIDQQPTAYDVNKVVERLQYAKNPYSDIDLRQYNNALDLAIAIVKRGGN